MSTPILEARGLRKYFTVAGTPFSEQLELKAVDGVDLVLRPGETLGLAGESGCGKSTVGKLLVNLLQPSAGEILFHGNTIAALNKQGTMQFRKEIQMIFQDPYASLNPRMHIGDIIEEPLKIHRLAHGREARERVFELMAKVGLNEEQARRFPHEFSGGQRQRVGIARALAVSPKVIIADEAVSALDLSIQAQIINLLQDLQKEFALSYVFIGHDLSVVRHISDRIAIMYLGRIVETGMRDDIFDRFLHPYTESLLSAIPRVSPEGKRQRIILKGDVPSPVHPPSGCPFHTRCPYAEPICVHNVPPLEEKEAGHRAACHFSLSLYR